MNGVIVKFIVSEGSEVQSNGFMQRQAIVNPVLVFSTPFIPTSLSLAATMVVSGISDGATHKIGFRIENYDTEKVIFSSGIADIEVNKSLENFVISADLKNVGFETEGEYKILLSIDGQEYFDSFVVKKVSEQ